MSTVTTINGNILPRQACACIKGEYYPKELTVKIGSIRYLKTDNRIFFDCSDYTWKRKRGVALYYGIVQITSTNVPVLGYFTAEPGRNIFVRNIDERGRTVSKTIYLDKSVLPKSVYYNKYNATWDDLTNLDNNKAIKIAYIVSHSEIGPANYNYSFPQSYSAHQHLELFTKLKRYPSVFYNLHTEDIKYFGNYTFGIEFETSKGMISQRDCFALGLIPLRDGSIGGNEYVTIPLQGEVGFNLLANQLKLLRSNTLFDLSCSTHIHLGGYPINKDKIWALYKLLYLVQSSVFTIFPKWATHTDKFKSTGKNYCHELSDFTDLKDLYFWASGGRTIFNDSFIEPHPYDREESHKWNINARYSWANIINLLFKPHGKTCEFRLHGPTFNSEKIINWLFICSALLQYADKHTEELIDPTKNSKYTYTLQYILEDIYPQYIANILITYCEMRESFFTICAEQFNDLCGQSDLENDAKLRYTNTTLVYDRNMEEIN